MLPCLAMNISLQAQSAPGPSTSAPAVAANSATAVRRKRLQRIATMCHIVIGITIGMQSVELLSNRPGLLAWLSLVAAVALVLGGVWELFAGTRHHLAMLVLQLVVGGEICLSAAEGFLHHKHYIQWVQLVSGLAAIVVAIVKYAVSRRGKHS